MSLEGRSFPDGNSPPAGDRFHMETGHTARIEQVNYSPMSDENAPIPRFTAVKAGEPTRRFAVSVSQSDYTKAADIARRNHDSIGGVFRRAFRIVVATQPDKLR